MDDYNKILHVVHLADLELTAVRLGRICEEDGAHAAAFEVRKAYLDFVTDLERLAEQWALAATAKLKEVERRTRVRPDTMGFGGPRLGDSLQADSIKELPGTVGIANESKLDNEVPWWSTNEEGSSARVGGEVHGFFTSGGVSGFTDASAPSADEFRTHPLFAPGKGPLMVIQNPIPARRFILKTIEEMEPAWHTAVKGAIAKLRGRWDKALARAQAVGLAEALRRPP